MTKHFFLALSVVFLMVSCSKSTNQTKGMPEMLRTGKWKITSATVKLRLPSGLDTTLNMFNFMPSCKTGVYLTFDTGFTGNMFTGTPCNPSDPTNIYFQWQLSNNNTILHLYDGFNLVYAITDTVLEPYYFDTTWYPAGSTPAYSLDTVVFAEDTGTPGYPNYIVLDTLWKLKYDSITDPYTDVYGSISNFSSSSFTMTFAEISVYPDSTHNHGTDPIYKPDTAHFTFVFNNF
jgi:hypothetical protein